MFCDSALSPSLFHWSRCLSAAQQSAPTTAAQAPNSDTSYIDAQGTAHVTRVVPVPATISPEAQQCWATPFRIRLRRRHSPSVARERDACTAPGARRLEQICPNQIVEDKIAGGPGAHRHPEPDPESAAGQSASSTSMAVASTPIPVLIANRFPSPVTPEVKVVAVLYRLAPENPFPAGIDDAIAVYKELLKTHKPSDIVIYGTSAGAIMTGEVAVKLKQLGLPMPARFGIFSGIGDFARAGDSASSILFAARPFRASRSAAARPA